MDCCGAVFNISNWQLQLRPWSSPAHCSAWRLSKLQGYLQFACKNVIKALPSRLFSSEANEADVAGGFGPQWVSAASVSWRLLACFAFASFGKLAIWKSQRCRNEAHTHTSMASQIVGTINSGFVKKSDKIVNLDDKLIFFHPDYC